MVKRKEGQYEYTAIYADDLLMASEEPQKIIQDLKEKFKLKSKMMDHWNAILVATTNLKRMVH